MGKTDGRLAVPVIAGLAVGTAFVVAFSLIAGSSSAGVVTDHYNRISLAIEGLKSTYESGEPIVLSVKAKGISDNACNYSSPSVVMRDDSNGKTIHWSHAGISTTLKCAGPEPIDKEWKFGDDAREEIMLDKPCPYTVLASYEGVKIEKKFSVG